MIRFKQATKIARFLTCSGKSAIPKANALGGDMEFIDSIHLGEDASGGLSRLLRPRTMSRGRREPRNKVVRRSKGGAIEPPMAKTMSPGRESLMSVLLAVLWAIRNRTRRLC